MPGADLNRARPLGPVPDGAGDLEWQARGVCRTNGHDPDKWFSDNVKDRRDAANLCKLGCPVVEQCLARALTTREDYGIWGGQQFAGGKIVPLRGRGRPRKDERV